MRSEPAVLTGDQPLAVVEATQSFLHFVPADAHSRRAQEGVMRSN